MEKKLQYSRIVVAAAAVFTLLSATGCSQSRPSVPVAKIERNFQALIKTNNEQTAITLAAKQHGWELVEKVDNGDYKFKKTLTKRRVVSGPQRWKRVYKDYDVYSTITVDGTRLSTASKYDNKNTLR